MGWRMMGKVPNSSECASTWSDARFFKRCGVSSPYLSNLMDLRSTGLKGYYVLGAAAVTDVQNALSVGIFSLSWCGDGDDNVAAELEEYDEANPPTSKTLYQPADKYVDNNTSNVDGQDEIRRPLELR